MEDSEKIERVKLEHPLPKEIQQMKRDDTVCQFCGVSYLIHREIKELENKLEKLEKELCKYKGIEEREAQLKNELQISQWSNEQLKKDSTQLASKLAAVTEENTANIADLEKQRITNKELEEKLNNHLESSEHIK
ncbi:protein LEKR1-like [Saccoglossus kowalevskii]